MTVLSVDAAGAYDHVSRGAMLRALHARPDHSDLQALLPYARWSYATASSYTCAIARGECHAIVQAEGGEQGDPLLPGLYSLAAHPALHDVQACLREREAVFAYLDDTYFVAAPKRIRELYAIVEDALWRHARVRLNAAKTQIWNAVGDEPADIRGLQADGGDPVWRLGFATRQAGPQRAGCESSRPASLQSSVFCCACKAFAHSRSECTFDTEAWGLELAVRDKLMATVGH